MEDWLWQLVPWGYRILLQIEGGRSAGLDGFFSAVTFMGSEWFYLAFLPIVYWAVSKQVGLGLSYAYLTSTYLNDWLKNLFAIPRPDAVTLDPWLEQAGITHRLAPLFSETSPSWPSNHTQGAVVTWGYLALKLGRWWFWVAAVLLAGLIGFSRMYGGVHFPQDVIGGLALGIVFLLIWQAAGRAAGPRLERSAWTLQLALAVAAPLLAYLLVPSESSAQIAGTLLGMGTGYLVESRTIDFQVRGSLLQRLLRALVGLVVVVAVYAGLKALFAGIEGLAALWLRMLRYTLVGLSASLAAPWLFVRVKLAGRASGQS